MNKKFNFFLKKYNQQYIDLIKTDNEIENKIIKFLKLIYKTKKNKKKIIIVGNGGSAAIASHFSVDITKNGNIRCINFNESDLLTCFANDYGYENWVKQALNFYSDIGDLVILISSSGNSMNMLNAAKYLKNKKNSLITFTGFGKKNKLSKCGKINFIVDSKNYNHIENTHQYWLLTVVDLLSKYKI